MNPYRMTAAGIAALARVGASALPAAADTLPAPGCTTDCTATFDTVGAAFDFEVPANISGLTVTLAGAAGAPPSFAITNDPTAVGGPGGAATIDLGTEYAGETLVFGIGGGSSLQHGSTLLAVAGGGGQGGYAAYFEFEDQILATYPGGTGGSPVAAGVNAGGTATAFGALAANGQGGAAAGGAGGTGDANGTAGSSTSTTTATETTLALGGAGGSYFIEPLTHEGGDGGAGYTGGGGGGIEFEVAAGDVPVDVAAPGGGGSGYLDASLSGTAEDPNPGGAFVSFTWSLEPTPPTPVLPSTGSTGMLWLAIPAAALLALGAFLLRRRAANQD